MKVQRFQGGGDTAHGKAEHQNQGGAAAEQRDRVPLELIQDDEQEHDQENTDG